MSTVVPEAPRAAWELIANAQFHLANRVMEAGDVQAWFLLADLQEKLIHPSPLPRRQFCYAVESAGGRDYSCPRLAIGEDGLCATHLAEQLANETPKA
jgi:hypothetical protein